MSPLTIVSKMYSPIKSDGITRSLPSRDGPAASSSSHVSLPYAHVEVPLGSARRRPNAQSTGVYAEFASQDLAAVAHELRATEDSFWQSTAGLSNQFVVPKQRVFQAAGKCASKSYPQLMLAHSDRRRPALQLRGQFALACLAPPPPPALRSIHSLCSRK